MTDERLIVPTYYMVALAAGTEPNQEKGNKKKKINKIKPDKTLTHKK